MSVAAWPGSAAPVERQAELGAVGGHAGAADLEDQLLEQLLPFALQRFLELLETALTEGPIGRPLGLVERPASDIDGAAHLRRRRIDDGTEHLLGGRVHVVEGLAEVGGDQLSLDEHARLRLRSRCSTHVSPLSRARTRPIRP